jgi:hypothetical protein
LRLTPEEEISILKSRIENFKHAMHDKNTFDYDIYNTSSPKKDRIRSWAEALERLHELGEYKEPLETISSHISQELKTMGLEKLRSYAREILPFKYKDTSKIHADKLLADQLEQNREAQRRENFNKQELIKRDNQKYIDELKSESELLSYLAKKMETTEFVSTMDPNVIDEHITHMKGMRKVLKQFADGREKVSPEKLHVLIYAYAQGTKSFAFTKYLEIMKKIKDMTPKQTVRLLTGRVTAVELLYEPTTRIEARQSGFFGTQCQECGSWRRDIKYDTNVDQNRLFCYACKSWENIKPEKLITKLV